jgi:hypothetical protein
VIKIAAAYQGFAVVAYGKPGLCFWALIQAVGCVRAAHFCGYPARLECVAVYILPFARHGKSQQNVVELRVAVGLRALPAAVDPVEVVQAFVALPVQARTDIN